MACPPLTRATMTPPRAPALVCCVALGLWLAATSARADADFATAPYLLDPQPERVSLLFELAAPHAAEVTLRGPEGERVIPSAAVAHHLVVLNRLTPDTSYAYSVRVAGLDFTRSGGFRTPRGPERDDARVCLYGDSRDGEPEHRKVIAALRRVLADEPAEAVVHLGDFAAEGGYLDEWVQPFVSIAPLAKDVGYLFVLGNHELNPRGSGRPHYRRFFGRAFGSTNYYVRRFGPLHLVVLDTNSAWDEGDPQVAWAERQLTSLRAAHADDFIVVLSHHPMFSSSLHEDHARLRAALEDVARANADLLVAGHDHTYERGTVDGLHYLVSGGGGSPLYDLNHRRPGQLAYAPVHHFVCLDARAGELTLRTTGVDGTLIEACRLQRGQPFVCADGTPGGVVGGVSPFRFWVTSRFFWRRMGPGLALLALVLFVTRTALLRWRERRRR